MISGITLQSCHHDFYSPYNYGYERQGNAFPDFFLNPINRCQHWKLRPQHVFNFFQILVPNSWTLSRWMNGMERKNTNRLLLICRSVLFDRWQWSPYFGHLKDFLEIEKRRCFCVHLDLVFSHSAHGTAWHTHNRSSVGTSKHSSIFDLMRGQSGNGCCNAQYEIMKVQILTSPNTTIVLAAEWIPLCHCHWFPSWILRSAKNQFHNFQAAYFRFVDNYDEVNGHYVTLPEPKNLLKIF